MWRRIMVCLVLGACGFQGNAVSDGSAPPIDSPATGGDAAVGDAAIDASPAPGCWQRWYDHQPQLGTAGKIMELSTSAQERDPWLSKDGLRLYFAREPGTHGMSDIYFARRPTPSDPFGTAAELPNLNTSSQESRAALSEDELALVLASDRGGEFQIYITLRNTTSDPFGSPNQNNLAAVNGPGSDTAHFDPFLTNHGLTLYFAPDPPTNERQHIWFTTRSDGTKPFPAAIKVPVINGNDTQDGDADPALSADQRVIVFSSTRAGGQGAGDLYYATRASASGDFGAPAPIPGVNSNSDDGDPFLSDDGCDLYFASTRAGDFDLYVARSTAPR